MNTTLNNYLQNIVQSICADSSTVHCLIRSYSQSNNKTALTNESNNIIEYTYSNSFTNPYEPFISWVESELTSHALEPAAILEQLNAPEIIKPVFINYFTEGCAMHEENLWECVDYEKEVIINLLIGMIDYFSTDASVIFVLNNIQYAPFSVIRLLQHLFKPNENSRLSILANYYAAAEITDYKLTAFKSLIRTTQINGQFIDYESRADVIVPSTNNTSLSKDSIDDCFNMINNNLEFRELEDAGYMLDVILNQIDNLAIDSNTAFELYELCAYNFTLLKKHNEVLKVCNNLLDNCNLDYSDYKMFTYHYYIGRAKLILGQKEDAKDSVDKALEYAKTEDNDYHIMLASILQVLISYYDCIHDCTVERANDEDLIALMNKYKYFNHIAILLCIWSDINNDYYVCADSIEHKCTNYMRTINLLNEHYNPRMLCSVYRFFIVRSSNFNYYVANQYFYSQYLKVLTKGSLEEIFAMLGMGYQNTINEHYNEANENYEHALNSCIVAGDVIHIAETLYNLSYNAFLAKNYSPAIDYASLCLWITDTMNYPGLFVTSLIRLHAIKALSHYRNNNHLLCQSEYSIISRIINNSKDIVNVCDDDIFFYNYIHALILYHSEDYAKSLEIYNIAETSLTSNSNLMITQYVPFIIDKIHVLEQLQLAVDNYASITSLLNQEKSFDRYDFSIKLSLSETIIDLIVRHKHSLQLKSQQKEREFVSEWLNLITQYTSHEVTLENIFTSFLYNCGMKDLILLINVDGKILQYTAHSDSKLPSENEMPIFEFYNRYSNGFVTDYLSSSYSEFTQLFELCNLRAVSSAFGFSHTEDNTSFILLSYRYSVEQNLSLTTDTIHISLSDLKMYVSLFQQLIRLLIK